MMRDTGAVKTMQESDHPIRVGTYTTLGSVIGTIETLSIARSQPCFRIREEVGNRSVVCSFDRDTLPAVRDAFGRRALVRGTLAYSQRGGLVRVQHVDEIMSLDANEIDSVDHLIGIAPDFTDNMPSETFLEALHNE